MMCADVNYWSGSFNFAKNAKSNVIPFILVSNLANLDNLSSIGFYSMIFILLFLGGSINNRILFI